MLYELVFDNGVTLYEIFDKFRQCGLLVVSKFLNINSEEEDALDNDAYIASAQLRNLILFQKSDIKLYELADKSTDGVWTFKKLWEHLRNQFNLELRIQGATLRIEHISYFEKDEGLDLTVEPYAIHIKGLHSFTYDSSKVARKEVWNFQENVSKDFAGVPIQYDCAGEEDNAEIAYSLQEINNDVAYIIANKDSIANSGFIFVNGYILGDVESFYSIISESSALSGALRVNGHMSIPNLQRNYWRWQRPLPSGTMNNTETVFESTVRREIQTALQIKLPRFTYHNSFNPNDLVKTQMGWGEVTNARYNALTGTLNLTIRH